MNVHKVQGGGAMKIVAPDLPPPRIGSKLLANSHFRTNFKLKSGINNGKHNRTYHLTQHKNFKNKVKNLFGFGKSKKVEQIYESREAQTKPELYVAHPREKFTVGQNVYSVSQHAPSEQSKREKETAKIISVKGYNNRREALNNGSKLNEN